MSKKYPNISTILLHDDHTITEIKLFDGTIIKSGFKRVDESEIKEIKWIDDVGFIGSILSSEKKRKLWKQKQKHY